MNAIDRGRQLSDSFRRMADHCEKYGVVSTVAESDAVLRSRADTIDGLLTVCADLLTYARLEAEYTRLCDRTRSDYSPTEFREWVEANVPDGEPVGRWLVRIRTAAIRKATGGQ